MPEENVTIKGKWSKLTLKKSMEGTIKESLTLYKQVKNDVNYSTKYARKYTGDTDTFNGNQEVYYYYGEASNNNVLFANYCWKIIRTTDTGGVKLLYNGAPALDGSCDNKRNNSALTASQMNTKYINIAFNSLDSSPVDVGYMYNIRYPYQGKELSNSITLLDVSTMLNNENYNYYYSDTYNYSGTTYYLEAATQYSWVDNYESLVGKYTCRDTSKRCRVLYYVIKVEEDKMYYLTLSSGKGITDIGDEPTMAMSDLVSPNEDGIYALNNPVIINKADWYANNGTYNNYYTCGSNVTSCDVSTMKYVTSTTNTGYRYTALVNTFKYGSSFTWDGTNYTLSEAVEALGLPDNINTYHYTCLNISGVCQEIKYIYNVYNSSARMDAYYLIISGGKSIEEIIDEMFYNDDVNTTNSTIKTVIDYWYANYMVEYTSYLEDTVWCNDRSISDLGGWNPNGGSVSTKLVFKSDSDRMNLTCKNKNDRFTVSEVNGNGALTYPVGLIDATEANLAFSRWKSPLASGDYYWGISPTYFKDDEAYGFINGNLGDYYPYNNNVGRNNYYVRPSVSLQTGIEYLSGDGSVEKPYVVDAEAIGYKISIQEGSDIKSSMDVASEGRTIKLTSILENYGVSSFKMNGTLINGSTFTMPATDVLITDVVLVPCLESGHNPYSNRLNEYKEKTFEGATSLTVKLDYQTESTSYDYIYLYDSTGKQYGKYGGTTRKTETITIPGNYIKILFHTNGGNNDYYGYKATITPNYG